MNPLLSQLVLVAQLVKTVWYECCADPHSATTITIDRLGNIEAKRWPYGAQPEPPLRKGLHPVHTIA
jgi:hypothetical protein